MSALTCPKCQADMRQYERNGVHVDQCTGCRGVFLDRGELEHLVDAELRWANQSPPAVPVPAPPPAPAPAQAPPPAQYPPQNQGYGDQGYGHQGYGKPPKKRKSFLEDLFD